MIPLGPTRDTAQPVVLTVAGFDPSAGAGILADIKTISFFGCYGVAAVTSLTFQNTKGVEGVLTQSKQTVFKQIAPLLDDFRLSAIKTGMLPGRDSVEAVVEAAQRGCVGTIVVDPVLKSTSGFALGNDGIGALVSMLFPLASLITPNIDEAQALTGVKIEDRGTMRLAAEGIIKMGARAVLITGGDLDGQTASDLLFDSTGATVFSSPRIESGNTHGTGCTLASAIVCLLVLGRPLREAIHISKRYVQAAISTAPNLGRGRGPLNHFPPDFRIDL